MPYLPEIIDKFLRRVGLTSGEKASLRADLDAVAKTGDDMTGMLVTKPSVGGIATTSSDPGLRVMSTGGNAAYVELHRQGAFAALLGIDSDNKLKFGGYSMGAVAHELWHGGNTSHNNPSNPCYFAASWGIGSTAREGDPLRPWQNYGSIIPPTWAGSMTVNFHDRSTVYLNLDETASTVIEVHVTGPGTLHIFANYRKNLHLRVYASPGTEVLVYLATAEGPTLSTGSLRIMGGRVAYVIAGVNTSIFGSTIFAAGLEISHVNEAIGGGGSGGSGSGSSYTYVPYDLDLFGCSVYSTSLYGDELRAFTTSFVGCGFAFYTQNLQNSYNG